MFKYRVLKAQEYRGNEELEEIVLESIIIINTMMLKLGRFNNMIIVNYKEWI